MAAQDAELKLKVSLDLAFFRQQLVGLGQAAAGYNMPINVKLDRSAITKELRHLERAIGKKKINVELNLLGGLTKDQLEKIQGRLEALSKTKKVEIPVSVKNGATGRDIQDAITGIRRRIAASQQIRQGNGKILIPTSIKPSITNADVSEFKKAVQQKLSGITVKVKAEVERGFAAGPTGAAGLFEYMRSQGLSGGNVPQATEVGRSERLKKALNDLTVKQLQALAKEQGIGGVSKMRKDPLIEKLVAELNQDIAENILGNIKNQLRDVGKGPLKSVLDTFARGLFNMLGMDAAAMRQQMAERRALPAVSFPATVPPRSFPIGPSSTGRALPPGAIPSALPGTAFGGQKYLPTDLGAELKQILRGAAYAFVDAVSREVRTARIGIGASMQAALPSARIAGLLPAGVGREPSRYATGAIGGETREQMMARRTAEAYARSALRGMDVMGGGAGRPPSPYSYAYRSARPTSAIVPYAAGGAMVATGAGAGGGGAVPPSGGGRGGFGGMRGFGGFGRALGGVNLPGAGTIRELGSEFAFATKQVLLFGQAYKMLGFIQAFPGQVGQAVAQLQSFRNTLNTVATSADDAAASNRLILDLVEKYNVPLQSARDGFTKLYASMAPAGFSGDEIRDLFTGITQAAATFGMSADKVDRVNYAFAQMASKGQVMSEELKGQLGDVLPGAMAIFAEAAGFEGPKAIQDFSAALEDGVYKGEAMNALLKNVGIVMKREFGPGAEGAARTFQGVINRMQNSMQLLYESFEPVAVGFLNSVVMPLTNGIKQISDGFTSFFTGAQAQTTGGFRIAQELEKLRPAFDGIRQNAAAVASQFKQFAQTALELAKVLLQIAGNPITGYLVKLYAIALPINMALNVMRGLWISNAAQLLIFNARVAAGTSTLTAFRGMMSATGATAATTATAIRTAGLTLRAFFASTGVGIVIVGISMLIEKFMSMNQALDDTRAKAMGAAQAIRAMTQTEAMQAKRSAESGVRLLETLQQRGPAYAGSQNVSITEKEGQQLRELGIPVSRTMGGFRAPIDMLESYRQRLQTVNIPEANARVRQLDFEAQKSQEAAVLSAIPDVGGDGKGTKGKKTPFKQILDLESERRARMQASNRESRLAELIRNAKLAGNEAEAESLQNLSKALDVQGKLKAMQEYRSELINKEDELLSGSLTKEEYNNKLQEANVKLHELSNDLKVAFYELQVNEADAAKKAVEELAKKIEKQKELNRLIEDAQIAAGVISPQAAAVLLQQREFEDAQARMKADGSPEQLLQLQAAQALIPEAGSLQETIKALREELDKLLSTQEMVKFSAASIGEAFSSSFKDAITGASSAQEALAGFFQSVASSFADMAAQMINKWLQMQLLGLAQSLLPGIGSFAGGAKIGQAVNMPTSVGIGAGGGILQNAGGQGFGTFGPNFGIRQFANGGLVTGPTMGLIGEGRYNEAVVPLPDGKTIPVDLGNAAGNQIVSNITVNVSNGQAQSNANGSNSSELGRKLEGAVKQVIVGELRPGGLLAR